ncbi:MAG: hypothetical protein ACD_37C00091G0002 [uncultured bacterium]|nr:MAG: hypothetical protein ACD_37C00091G0002 [uncultured bacterium]
MKKKTVSRKNQKITDLIIIILYLGILGVLAFLVWKLLGPVFAAIISVIIAYVFDLRKFLGKK